jgi:hypothetical protein
MNEGRPKVVVARASDLLFPHADDARVVVGPDPEALRIRGDDGLDLFPDRSSGGSCCRASGFVVPGDTEERFSGRYLVLPVGGRRNPEDLPGVDLLRVVPEYEADHDFVPSREPGYVSHPVGHGASGSVLGKDVQGPPNS